MTETCLPKRYSGDRDVERFYVEMGALIALKRKAAGLSQGQLAALIGLSRPSLSLIEAGRQRIQAYTLAAIADVLSIPFEALLPQ